MIVNASILSYLQRSLIQAVILIEQSSKGLPIRLKETRGAVRKLEKGVLIDTVERYSITKIKLGKDRGNRDSTTEFKSAAIAAAFERASKVSSFPENVKFDGTTLAIVTPQEKKEPLEKLKENE